MHNKIPIPQRCTTADKRTFGTVLGIGGSRGMAGAVAMAGKSALLAGAGLVQLAVPDPVLETVAGFYPEYTTIPCPADAAGRFSLQALPTLLECAGNAASVFIGPGLGRSSELTQLIGQFLQQAVCPVVIDADALQREIFEQHNGNNVTNNNATKKETAFILTPHCGEFARLTGKSVPPEEQPVQRQETASAAALKFAEKHPAVLVLKGHRSIITDGSRLELNTTGNPGMATGGSGDVLTGLIAGLLAQRLMPVFDTVCLAVHLHGSAGDSAAAELGELSVTATAILAHIPAAMRIASGG
ncbi:MAG: NAD(P)H-hydrate dehydratase [Planctomycetaceae bacterium]|jgi:NAD(P)H-hydrate epimerase|nr:NAD(P)H-hydrate dehydratase [Planctomycetaceae bacterium]